MRTEAMRMTRTIAALLIAQLVTVAAVAQEFGRTSGGQIEATTKSSDKLSASFSMMMSGSASRYRGYEATLGGTIIEDRLWFFGSAFQQNGSRFGTSSIPALQQSDIDRLAFGKATAQIGDRHLVDSSIMAGPSSFLSLHYTGIVSPSAFFTAAFSRSSTSQRDTVFGALRQ